MNKPPTIKDVAREAGVSSMTVSRVVNGTGRISASTTERVLGIIERIGYVPDRNAGSLSSKSSGFVAILVPSIDNSNFAQMVRGAADVLEEAGRQILVGTTDFTIHREEKVLLEILRRRPDGVVLVGGSHSPRTRNLLTVAGIPVVETWDLPEQPLGHVVGFSNSGVFSALVDHLVERQYKNIAFVGVDSPDDTRGVSRMEGFRIAMKRHGLDPGRVVQMGAPPASVEAGGEAIVVVRRNWPDVDAVLFISDRTAYGALMEAKRRGWDVPGDIAITGFGDFDMARNSHPRITSVEIDCAGIGRKAARIVLDHGPKAGNESRGILQPETVLMNFRILSRETS